MKRAEKRRQAKKLKKEITKMSLSEVEEFVVALYDEGVEDITIKVKEALNKEFGFGEKRQNIVFDSIKQKNK